MSTAMDMQKFDKERQTKMFERMIDAVAISFCLCNLDQTRFESKAISARSCGFWLASQVARVLSVRT